MSEERIRREKVLVLRKIKCDNTVDSLDGPNPQYFNAGDVVPMPSLLIAHYSRNKCVTRDIPEGE